MSELRVTLDATSLAGPRRTGVGTYTAQLLHALSSQPDLRLAVAAFTVRGREALRQRPESVRLVHRPVPARLLQRAWQTHNIPSAELVMGRADVVHGTNFVLPPVRHAAGVVTVHDLTYLHHPEWVSPASLRYRELVPRAIRRAGAVVTITQAVAAELAEAYAIEPERIAVTHLGVAPEWFAPAQRPTGWPSEYVLAVGNIEPRKGIDVLLHAYRRMLADHRDLPPLVVVGPPGWGDQPDFASLPRDRVLLAGYLDTDELRGAVAHASVLAFPSRYEGFGLPPLEALAAGTPVVASDIPAIREVVGTHATLVPVDDDAALADALSRTLDDPPDAVARGAAREHAATFTWQSCAEATLAVYRRVSP